MNSDVKRQTTLVKLPYPLEKGSIEAYDELMGVLYKPEEERNWNGL